jgi:hypothetical protein
MQTAASNNLVFTDFSSFKRCAEFKIPVSYGGFYQQIASALIKGVNTNEFFTRLGGKLVAAAEHAYSLRQMEAVEEAGRLLSELPMPGHYSMAGQYFRALHMIRQGDLEAAQSTLEPIAEGGPHKYQARARQSLAVTFHMRGDLRTAWELYLEAGRSASRGGFDPLAAFQTGKNIVVLKSEGGDHRGALAQLESLMPLIRAVGSVYPPVYFDYLNSLAVEMMEVGRLEEARRASELALASAYAHAYPEWRETRNDILLRGRSSSRSVVTFSQVDIRTDFEPHNVVRLPTSSHGPVAMALSNNSQSFARVIKFPSRTSPMPEENGQDQSSLGNKRRFVADKLYEMLMATLEDESIDADLVEEIYRIFLKKAKEG